MKECGYVEYECEFCHELFNEKGEAEMHEAVCECRPENFPALKKKYDDKWFGYKVDGHDGHADMWFYVHCLNIFTDEEGPAAKYREITLDTSGYLVSETDTDDLNDFIYQRLEAFHEVPVEDVRKHIIDTVEEWF